MADSDPLGTHLGALAAADPDRIAITCGEDSVTRGELDALTNRLARAFLAAGVKPDTFVTISMHNSIGYLAAAIAAWKCGATPQPLSARLPAREREAIIELARPSLIIGLTEDELSGRPGFPADFVPDSGLDDSPLPPCVPAAAWKAPTSGGSTGRPKLIVATQPAVCGSVQPFGLLLGMTPEGTILVTGPLHHNAPFLAASCALALGCHVVLMARFDAAESVSLVEKHSVDWMYAVPTMMSRIWRLPEEQRRLAALDTLRVVMHMAAPCPAWLKRVWLDWLGPDRVWELYAATEVQAVTILKGGEWLAHPGTVGRPAIGEMQILDADRGPVLAGTIGEVWMRRGEGAGSPYRYVGAEAKVIAGGWETVGDMGWLDDEGYLYLADRDTDMIIVGGSNVYPAEVESALTEHPAVTSAIVIGLPDEDLGQVPHALLELAGDVNDDELTRHLRERLVSYKLPRSFERVAGALRDDAGKVRRGELVAARTAAVSR